VEKNISIQLVHSPNPEIDSKIVGNTKLDADDAVDEN